MSWVYFPRVDKSSDPKGWIQGNTHIGPVLEVTTRYLQGKHGVEIRIESVNKDNSRSLVRISHGLNKLVTDLIDKKYDDNEQETSTTKTEVFAFASRSKAEAQPRRPSTTCSSSRTTHTLERKRIDIEPGAQFDQAYLVAKRINILLRHGELPREEDGAIEFWRLKDDLRKKIEYSQCWSDDVWKSKMAGGGGNKKIYQYCTDSSWTTVYLRALQGHSGRNPIDPTLQNNVLIPDVFFEYIYHIGCAVSVHSITNSGLIAGGQNSSRERQTVFFTAVNPMHKNHKFPQELDLTKPRTSSIVQAAVEKAPRYGVLGRYTACSTERIEVLSNKIERNHPPRYTPSLLYLESDCDESEEIIYQKVYVSPRPPPKISYKDNWMCDLDSDIAGSSKDTQRIEPKPKTQLSSTGRPVCGEKQEIATLLIKRNMMKSQTQQVRRDPYWWIKKRSTKLISEYRTVTRSCKRSRTSIPKSCCDGIWRNYIRESVCVTSASSNGFLQR